MRRPPDKRKTPRAEGGAFQLDNNNSRLGQTEHNPDSQSHQGSWPYALLPCPVAVARQFGFCHAVFVRHLSGQEERRGLFESAENASLAARELNRLFDLEASA